MGFRWAPGLDISMTPVRTVIGRSSQINNGWHRTNKHPMGYVPGESSPELLFLMFAELDPNISLFTAQPCTVGFSFDGKACEHTPDFAVVEAGASIIVEVKSDRQYGHIDLKRRLRAAARSVEARGWPYFVALRGDMERDPRFPNIEDLWRRHRRNFTDLQRLAAENAVSHGPRRVRDIVQEASRAGLSDVMEDKHVLSMAANAALFIDLTQPVGPDSLVRLPDPQAMPDPLLTKRRPADDLPWEMAA